MTAADFLRYLLTAGGCGTVTFALIALATQVSQDRLPAGVRFYGAMALAVLLPLGALFGLDRLGVAPLSWDGLVTAGGVTFAVSQTIHFQTSKAAPSAGA